MVNNWVNIIQDYLFPPTCILCGNPGQDSRDICSACYYALPTNQSCCYQCGEPFDIKQSTLLLCGKCQKQRPAFDATHAPFLYQDVIRHLISNLKFNNNYKNARLLGTLLAEKLRNQAEMPEIIIPVPFIMCDIDSAASISLLKLPKQWQMNYRWVWIYILVSAYVIPTIKPV